MLTHVLLRRGLRAAVQARAVGLALATGCSLTLDLDHGRSCTVDEECAFEAGIIGVCVDGRCERTSSTDDALASSTGAPAPTPCTDVECSTSVASSSSGVDAPMNPETGSTTDGSSSSGGTTGGEAWNPECPPPYPAAALEPLLDDLEIDRPDAEPDNALPQLEGRRGQWFLFNDGSGTQQPMSGEISFEGGAEGTMYCAHTSVTDVSIWGGGMGFSLNRKAVDCPYDLSAFDGLQFWARGSGTWRVAAAVPTTTPTDGGGVCEGTCLDHFGSSIALTADWVQFQVAWTDFEQVGWGDPGTFDPGQIIHIQFARTAASGTFEAFIDEVSLF